MGKWAYERGVELDFSRLGKPTDNAMVERKAAPRMFERTLVYELARCQE
jgi:transposase InsO family protein